MTTITRPYLEFEVVEQRPSMNVPCHHWECVGDPTGVPVWRFIDTARSEVVGFVHMTDVGFRSFSRLAAPTDEFVPGRTWSHVGAACDDVEATMPAVKNAQVTRLTVKK